MRGQYFVYPFSGGGGGTGGTVNSAKMPTDVSYSGAQYGSFDVTSVDMPVTSGKSYIAELYMRIANTGTGTASLEMRAITPANTTLYGNVFGARVQEVSTLAQPYAGTSFGFFFGASADAFQLATAVISFDVATTGTLSWRFLQLAAGPQTVTIKAGSTLILRELP